MFRSVATQAIDCLYLCLWVFERARAAELVEPKGVATEGMPEEVPKMLNALKYNMSDKFQGSDDLRARSQLALERHRSLPSEEKHAFLNQFQQRPAQHGQHVVESVLRDESLLDDGKWQTCNPGVAVLCARR